RVVIVRSFASRRRVSPLSVGTVGAFLRGPWARRPPPPRRRGQDGDAAHRAPADRRPVTAQQQEPAPHGTEGATPRDVSGDWRPDVLGGDWEALTLPLRPDEQGEAVATLVRRRGPRHRR